MNFFSMEKCDFNLQRSNDSKSNKLLTPQNTLNHNLYNQISFQGRNVVSTFKGEMSSSRFFRYFLFFGWGGASKVCRVGTRWMQNLILHPMSSLDRNLSKNTERYVENRNKKVVFSFLPPKLINIILLF